MGPRSWRRESMGENKPFAAIAAVLVAVISLLTSPIWGPVICRAVGQCRPTPVVTSVPSSPPRTPNPPTQGHHALDPERYSSASAAWWFQYADSAGINDWLDRNHARALDVEVYGADAFSVVSIDNRNAAYTRTPEGSSSWTTNETQGSLSSRI